MKFCFIHFSYLSNLHIYRKIWNLNFNIIFFWKIVLNAWRKVAHAFSWHKLNECEWDRMSRDWETARGEEWVMKFSWKVNIKFSLGVYFVHHQFHDRFCVNILKFSCASIMSSLQNIIFYEFIDHINLCLPADALHSLKMYVGCHFTHLFILGLVVMIEVAGVCF